MLFVFVFEALHDFLNENNVNKTKKILKNLKLHVNLPPSLKLTRLNIVSKMADRGNDSPTCSFFPRNALRYIVLSVFRLKSFYSDI